MPQLAKGGKWVFGWVTVGPQREVVIPADAFAEYGFRVGEPVRFLRGSRRSGGFSVGRLERLAMAKIDLSSRVFGQGTVGSGGKVQVPEGVGVEPGTRLLVVRGSGLALGFLQRGPIYEEALSHPELE